MPLAVRGQRIVLPDGERPAMLHIDAGRIVAIAPYDAVPAGVALIEAGSLVVSPGLVDSHVHINEPGRAEWEGFDTATLAAAAGGITTLVDMPLNSVPATTSVDGLEAKRAAAKGRCHVDVAFWGGIVPGSEASIAPLIAAGVRGFKCFLTPSGVEEFGNVSEADLRRALPLLAAADPERPLLVHAEDPAALAPHTGSVRSYAAYLATRPAAAEVSAIELMAKLSAEYAVPTHIVHVSSAAGIAAVRAAALAGTRITCETCPHYLTFTARDIPDGATAFKCAPPIRTEADRQALWRALETGACAMVVTDHSPSPPAMKCLDRGDYVAAWGGIASLQLSLSLVWTGARGRGFTPTELAGWMSAAPARLAGLTGRKGAIAVGCDADLVLWDPEATFTVDGAQLRHRHAVTPYEGQRLRGAVVATYLRGEPVWREGVVAGAPAGRLL